MRYQFLTDAWNEVEWSERTASLGGLSIYQTWPYVHLHSRGALRSASRAALLDSGRVLVAGQLRIKRLPVIGAGVAEMEWAPLCAPDVSDEALRAFFAGVRSCYCEKQNLEVRIYPRIMFDRELDIRIGALLSEQGFQHDPAVRPYHTFLIDLRPSLEELRAKLHRKWRQHLNAAERSGLTLEKGSAVGLFDRLIRVYEEMWRVKRFPSGVRVTTMRRVHELLPASWKFHVIIASHEGLDVGGRASATLGNTCHGFLSATLPGDRQEARPGYLMHWANIEWAQQQGYRWYDVGGYDEEAIAQLTEFKRRMGGESVVFPGAFVARASKTASRLYRQTELAYRRLRGLLTGR